MQHSAVVSQGRPVEFWQHLYVPPGPLSQLIPVSLQQMLPPAHEPPPASQQMSPPPPSGCFKEHIPDVHDSSPGQYSPSPVPPVAIAAKELATRRGRMAKAPPVVGVTTERAARTRKRCRFMGSVPFANSRRLLTADLPAIGIDLEADAGIIWQRKSINLTIAIAAVRVRV